MILTTLQTIWALTTLVFLVAAVPYLIWLGILVWRKQWRKAVRRTLLLVGAYVLLSGVAGIASSHYHATEHHRIFGTKFELGTPLYEYHSPRAFNGDGYSLRVYPLSDAVRTRFDRSQNQALPRLTASSTDRKDWSMESWRSTPIAPEFEKHVDFTLSSYDQRNNRELMDRFDAIRTALNGEHAYYAFCYYAHGDYVANIDFYLVDLANGKIYLINHNT